MGMDGCCFEDAVAHMGGSFDGRIDGVDDADEDSVMRLEELAYDPQDAFFSARPRTISVCGCGFYRGKEKRLQEGTLAAALCLGSALKLVAVVVEAEVGDEVFAHDVAESVF